MESADRLERKTENSHPIETSASTKKKKRRRRRTRIRMRMRRKASTMNWRQKKGTQFRRLSERNRKGQVELK